AACQASPLEKILSRLVMVENGTDTKHAWPGHLPRAKRCAGAKAGGRDRTERSRHGAAERHGRTATAGTGQTARGGRRAGRGGVVDLARGMLMEQLGCTPAEAQRQLVRLAAESGTSTTELAAQITHTDPPGEPPGPDMPQVSLARAAIETAASGNAVARALLG